MSEHKLEINGKQFVIATHPPRKGLRLSLFVAGLIPGPLKALMKSAGAKLSDGASLADLDVGDLADNLDIGAIGEGLESVVEKLLDNETVLMQFFEHVDCIGIGNLRDERAFDRAFDGDYAALYRVLFEVVKVNGFIPLGNLSKS